MWVHILETTLLVIFLAAIGFLVVAGLGYRWVSDNEEDPDGPGGLERGPLD